MARSIDGYCTFHIFVTWQINMDEWMMANYVTKDFFLFHCLSTLASRHVIHAQLGMDKWCTAFAEVTSALGACIVVRATEMMGGLLKRAR